MWVKVNFFFIFVLYSFLIFVVLGKLVSVNYKLLILEIFLKWVSILFIIVFNIIGVYKFIFFFVVCCN